MNVHHEISHSSVLSLFDGLGEDIGDVELRGDVLHLKHPGVHALAQVVVAPRHVLGLVEGLRVVRQRDRRLVVDPEAGRTQLREALLAEQVRARGRSS